MDWQSIITTALVKAVEDALDVPGTDKPDWETVLRAFDDAEMDAREVYVEAIKEACRNHGVEPETSFVYPPIPVRDFDWSARDTNDDGEEVQLVGWGWTETDAIYDLLQQVREKFE